MKEHIDWNDRYRDGNLPWDTGRPSSELQRVFSRNTIQPCRALEIGCGTGTNSVWLAQQGFEVTGIDLAPLAVEQAEKRAHAAGVKVHFVVADVLHLPDLDGPFAFFTALIPLGVRINLRFATPPGNPQMWFRDLIVASSELLFCPRKRVSIESG